MCQNCRPDVACHGGDEAAQNAKPLVAHLYSNCCVSCERSAFGLGGCAGPARGMRAQPQVGMLEDGTMH